MTEPKDNDKSESTEDIGNTEQDAKQSESKPQPKFPSRGQTFGGTGAEKRG